MKKGIVWMAVFTGVFVGISVFLSEFLMPDSNLIISVSIAILSASIGGLIGNKLFIKS